MLVARQPGDTTRDDLGTETFGLFAHLVEQGRAGDAERKAGAVVAARDPARAAVAAIDHHDTAMETRQVGRGRQSCRAGADDQHIELELRFRHR